MKEHVHMLSYFYFPIRYHIEYGFHLITAFQPHNQNECNALIDVSTTYGSAGFIIGLAAFAAISQITSNTDSVDVGNIFLAGKRIEIKQNNNEQDNELLRDDITTDDCNWYSSTAVATVDMNIAPDDDIVDGRLIM